MANLSSKTGFTPTTTRVSLANNTATTVQNMSAYDGQILTGFVYVDATTDYRAVVIVQVVKNGAGTYEVAAADISGDDIGGSPIVTFSMIGTNLVATLPNFTGFASAYIQYKLDAPALGANFPLSIDASAIVSGTVSDARLPVASASTNGIVNQSAQTFTGLKTFSSGINLGNTNLSIYREYGPITLTNIGGSAYFTRIGNMVFATFTKHDTATDGATDTAVIPVEIRPTVAWIASQDDSPNRLLVYLSGNILANGAVRPAAVTMHWRV